MGRKEEYKLQNERYLEALRAENDIRELPCGILYRVLEEGNGGNTPRLNSIVTVHYKGTLINGREFDNSWKRNYPEAFRLNEVIEGCHRPMPLRQPLHCRHHHLMQWDMVHVAVALFLLSLLWCLTSSYWELRKYGLIMKILIINGSPRKQGHISKMLQLMETEARANGDEVTVIRVADLQIRPCIGCMSCREKLKCCLPEDDAQRVLKQIEEAQALIIGAPCYWGNLPGQLKVMFDRIVYGMMGETSRGIPIGLHKGKKAVIVSTCTTPYPFNIFFNQTRGVVKALKEILKWSGFKVVSAIEKGGTKQHPGLTEREMKRCRRVIHKL